MEREHKALFRKWRFLALLFSQIALDLSVREAELSMVVMLWRLSAWTKTEADEPDRTDAALLERQEEAQWPDEMQLHGPEDFTPHQCLPHKTEFVVLDVAQALMSGKVLWGFPFSFERAGLPYPKVPFLRRIKFYYKHFLTAIIEENFDRCG